jgi:16S rRNA (guanine527-N7)-methyltransferase
LLIERAGTAGLARVDERVMDGLETYYELLSRWNAKINLTALPLDPPTGHAIDRLFIEPLVAATHLPETVGDWYDVGSGAGSPAIPMFLVRPGKSMVLVESRERKAAFLREVARTLGLPAIQVANQTIQAVSASTSRSADLITVRAVRLDSEIFRSISTLLNHSGRVFFFHGSGGVTPPGEWTKDKTVKLLDTPDSSLTVAGRTFHVEH